MTTPSDERRQWQQLDALANKSATKFFAFSPNDVLVQVALPLVLILAIATRLMTIGQSLASKDKGPVILDLWKQQLILRVDSVMDQWERSSGLAALPDFERVLWQGAWPDDARFKQVCEGARALADLPQFSNELYEQALRYQPDAAASPATSNQFAYLVQMYDPQSSVAVPDPDAVPAEFRITPERRAFAQRYIEERGRKWLAQVENLQWNAVERLARSLPIDDAITDASLPAQMKKLAGALAERGYPLLPSVVHEY
jgi:hypothetical protein